MRDARSRDDISMEAELQQTLDELCGDLLSANAAAAAACDQQPILQSLTLLAVKFPQVQRILGQSLASHYTGNDDKNTSSQVQQIKQTNKELPVKLSVLTKRFLYRRDTASSTIALLAALAHANQFNQQRIVRSVTGVRITRPRIEDPIRTTVFDAGKIKKKIKKKTTKAQQPLVLYALTVPDSVKSAFRKWRKRQKLLQNHRIPSGAPPEQGGIPKSCHCNGCLGAEQFLPTWQLHFQDLNRWRNDPDADEQTMVGSQSCSLLASDAFFQVFLQDFRLCIHDPVIQSEENDGEKKRLNVFYFVPATSDAEPKANTSPPPAFDPLQHVCAIEIGPEINVEEAGLLKRRSEMAVSPSRLEPSTGSSTSAAYEIIQSVILLEGHANLSSCSHDSGDEADTTSAAEPIAPVAEGGLATFLAQIEVQAVGEPVTRREIEAVLITRGDDDYNDAEDDDNEPEQSPTFLSEPDRKILRCVLDFLADDDIISLTILRGIMAVQPNDSSTTPLGEQPLEPQGNPMDADSDTEAEVQSTPDSATSSFSFQFTACVDTRELILRCASEDDLDAEESASQAFSASIPLETLFPNEDSTSSSSLVDPLSLLCIEERELRAILTRCQICFCSKPPLSSCAQSAPRTPIYCYRVQQIAAQRQQSSPSFEDDQYANEDIGKVHESIAKKPSSSAAAVTPVPGLPDGLASTLLTKIEALVLTFNTSSSSSESTKAAFTAAFTEVLAIAIKSCNTRITNLATSQAIDGISTSSEAHRKAGMERCRQCRDLLIQLGKKVKLVLESSSYITATISASDALITADQLARISKLAGRSVAQVQTQSQSVHTWETPDVRVDKLHLSRHVWASGVPDPEFYRERDEQQRENKKKQRQLTQLLMGNHNKLQHKAHK